MMNAITAQYDEIKDEKTYKLRATKETDALGFSKALAASELRGKAPVLKFKREVKYYYKHALSSAELAVWDALAYRAADKNGCGAICVKHEKLAFLAKVSMTTARRAVKKLCELGILTIVHIINPKRKGYGANVYVFKPSAVLERQKEANEHTEMNIRPSAEIASGSKDEGAFSNANNYNCLTTQLKDYKDKDRKGYDATPVIPNVIDMPMFTDMDKHSRNVLATLGGKLANSVWRKAVQAYSHSALYTAEYSRSVRIQELLGHNEALAVKLAHTLQTCAHKYGKGAVHSDFLGYVYKAAASLFMSEYERICNERYAASLANGEIEAHEAALLQRLEQAAQQRTQQRLFTAVSREELDEIGVF